MQNKKGVSGYGLRGLIAALWLLCGAWFPMVAAAEESGAWPTSGILDDADAAALQQKQRYDHAAQAFRFGSYREAADGLAVLVNNADGRYYLPSLLLAGRAALSIGCKSGDKTAFRRAESYLNLYIGRTDTPEWPYYYAKGMVYENLDFFERAEVYYRRAIAHAKLETEIAKALAGLLRVAVLRGGDLPPEYLVPGNVHAVQSASMAEQDFIQGMAQMLEHNDAAALKRFQSSVISNETYFIEHPDEYLMVAECAFCAGRYKEAGHFYRRIIAVSKSRDAVEKAMMRMGDLAWRRGDKTSAFNAYTLVTKKFPQTDLGVVARLKLIHLSGDSSTEGASATYVAHTLATNRRTYVGLYALANFGEMTFGLDSARLDRRMVWELSLSGPIRPDADQIAYFDALWKPKLTTMDNGRVCRLYEANAPLFESLFDRETLAQIAQKLDTCGEHDAQMRLMNFIVRKWHTDEGLLRMAQVLYQEEAYAEALKVLGDVRERGCDYAKALAQNEQMLSIPAAGTTIQLREQCNPDDDRARLLIAFNALDGGESDAAAAFALHQMPMLQACYGEERVGYRFTRRLVTDLVNEKRYETARRILVPLTENIHDNCFLNSMVLLSSIRLGDVGAVEAESARVQPCETAWATIAKKVYDSYRLSEHARAEQ